jgi:hypothetical protein
LTTTARAVTSTPRTGSRSSTASGDQPLAAVKRATSAAVGGTTQPVGPTLRVAPVDRGGAVFDGDVERHAHLIAVAFAGEPTPPMRLSGFTTSMHS